MPYMLGILLLDTYSIYHNTFYASTNAHICGSKCDIVHLAEMARRSCNMGLKDLFAKKASKPSKVQKAAPKKGAKPVAKPAAKPAAKKPASGKK